MANRKTAHPARKPLHQPAGLDVWQRLTRLIALLVIFVVVALGFVYYLPEREELDALRSTNAQLTQRRDDLLAQKAEKLRLESKSLVDPAYLEVIARDRLNLQLPGETVIRINSDR